MAETVNGRFVWYELMTSDVKGAIAFYGEVVGWKTQPWEDGSYTMFVGTHRRRSSRALARTRAENRTRRA